VVAVLPGITPDAGTETSFVAVAEELTGLGVRFHLVLLTDRQTLVPPLRELGVQIHDLSGHRTLLGRTRAIRSLVADLRPDVVHASLHEATIPTQLALVGTGVPLLVSWVNTNYGEGRLGDPGVTAWKLGGVRLVEGLLGRASGSWYHAVTPAVGLLNGQAIHAPMRRVLLGERGRDPDRFPFRDGRRAPRPGGLPVDEDGEMVLAVGRQEHQKDYPLLLRSFDRLARRRPGVELVVAGRPGAATPEIEHIRAGLSAADRIHLVGQRDDVPDLLRSADVVVCSSRREGAAGALVEAMATGVPVVSVRVAGLEGVLLDGENSVVVARDDLDLGIERVLDDADLAERLTRTARRDFEARFTTTTAAARMRDLYAAVARTARGERPQGRLLVTG